MTDRASFEGFGADMTCTPPLCVRKFIVQFINRISTVDPPPVKDELRYPCRPHCRPNKQNLAHRHAPTTSSTHYLQAFAVITQLDTPATGFPDDAAVVSQMDGYQYAVLQRKSTLKNYLLAKFRPGEEMEIHKFFSLDGQPRRRRRCSIFVIHVLHALSQSIFPHDANLRKIC